MPPAEDSRACLRCSHDDREAVADRLREAAGDGRLDLDELDERLERALSAKTYAELDALVGDLPVPGGRGAAVTARSSGAAVPEVMKLTAVISDRKQTGRWVVPPRVCAEARLGSVKIDFTDAVCPQQVVHVEAKAWVASVVLIVPEGWGARTDEVTSGAGSVRNKVSSSTGGDAPMLHVTGRAMLGDIVVRHARRSRLLPR